MADVKLLLYFTCLIASVSCEFNDEFKALVARIEQLEHKDVAKQRELEANEERLKQLEQQNDNQRRKIEELEDANEKLYKQLEERDAAVQQKIGEFEVKEDRLNLELNELKEKLDSKLCKCDKLMDNETSKYITANDKHKNKNRKVRMAPEEEVAFYVTHTQHDIVHLGANQALTFDNIITNIGNAFSNYSGVFVAPVQGTYVFHGTVMGRSVHNTTHNKFSAHFDVDGTRYSRFWVSAYDQSSQMLIIELNPGQHVSIRNDHVDEGFIGQHYTTFSGFLLSQRDNNGVIVGK